MFKKKTVLILAECVECYTYIVFNYISLNIIKKVIVIG